MNLAQRNITPQLGGPAMNQLQGGMGGGGAMMPPPPGAPTPEDPDMMAQLAQLAQMNPELLRAIMAKMQQQPGEIAKNFNPVQFAAGIGDKMNPGMGLLGYLGGGSGGGGV